MRYTYTTPRALYLSEDMYKACDTKAFCQSTYSTAVLGHGVMLDIAKAPHVLVAGASGSGKSCLLHNIICSLMIRNNPKTARFLLIDPKMVEFEYFYRDYPLLYCPVVTDPADAVKRLEQADMEMMARYAQMRKEGKRLWDGAKLYIVIDEIADLLAAQEKRIKAVIEKIARLGRGAGCHLIVATQHPTREVLSRQITANLDTQICLRVKDYHASRLIIGRSGGENLKGRGDAIMYHDGEFRHFQAAYIDDESLEKYARSWKMVIDTPLKPLKDLIVKMRD